MKTLKISSILVLSALFLATSACSEQKENKQGASSETNVLPEPKKGFFDNSIEAFNYDIIYLNEYIGTDGERSYQKDSIYGDSVNYVQKFKGGIIYSSKALESGNFVQITFPGYEAKELVKFINWCFRTEENAWDKNKRKYEPIEGGAGCYYEIKQDRDKNYLIEVYCGC